MNQHIEQGCDADPAGGRRAENGRQRPRANAALEAGDEGGRFELALFQICLGQLIVGLRDGLDEAVPGLSRGRLDVPRDAVERHWAGRAERRHRHEIDGPAERSRRADRPLQRDHLPAEAFRQTFDDPGERRVLPVHPRDHHDPAQALPDREAPGLVGLHLRARGRVDRDEDALDGPQRADDFADEVGIPRGVDEVQLHVLPLERRERGIDGNLPADLLGVEIRGGGPVLHPSEPVHSLGREQHRFDQ